MSASFVSASGASVMALLAAEISFARSPTMMPTLVASPRGASV
jgi:hypothetical protein